MLSRRFRCLLSAGLVSLLAGACVSGASRAPEAYTPDPALKVASRSNLESRVRRACTITQARLTSTAESALQGSCGCYARTTLRSLDASEIEAYRTTGYFNDSARAKALSAIDSCKLQRPV